MIIRGHEVDTKGYKYQMSPKNNPLTLTVFSAPNYCDTYHNQATIAVLKVLQIVNRITKLSWNPLKKVLIRLSWKITWTYSSLLYQCSQQIFLKFLSTCLKLVKEPVKNVLAIKESRILQQSNPFNPFKIILKLTPTNSWILSSVIYNKNRIL